MVRKDLKNKKRHFLCKPLIFSAVLFIGAVCFRVHCAGNLAVKNGDLDILTDRKIALEKEIALLEYEESKYSSLKAVEDKALQLGFIKATGSLISIDMTSGTPIASAVK